MSINNSIYRSHIDLLAISYWQVEILIMPLVDLDWKKHNKKECGLTVGKKLPLGAWFAFMLQKDSPWNKFVNDRCSLFCS